jgi:hypothetical protein
MNDTSQQWHPVDEVMASPTPFYIRDFDASKRFGCRAKAVDQQSDPALMARRHLQDGFRIELEHHGIRTDSLRR